MLTRNCLPRAPAILRFCSARDSPRGGEGHVAAGQYSSENLQGEEGRLSLGPRVVAPGNDAVECGSPGDEVKAETDSDIEKASSLCSAANGVRVPAGAIWPVPDPDGGIRDGGLAATHVCWSGGNGGCGAESAG